MEKGLSLTRRTGESCVCSLGGQEIEVKVEAIDRKRVRLRFVADRSVTILREELILQKRGD